MRVFPKPMIERRPLDLRQGIKSSLPDVKKMLGLYITFYLINDEKPELEYTDQANKIITIKKELFEKLSTFYDSQIAISNITDFESKVNATPLFKTQIEPLQVALNLYWKLGKINFVEDSHRNSRERTGGTRYAKKICFSANMIIIRNLLINDAGEINNDAKNLLFDLVFDTSLQNNTVMQNKLFETICVFSEEMQFKIRDKNLTEILFLQESIYNEILNSNDVVAQDYVEDVGPFRVLKNVITDGLHPFLEKEKKSSISFIISPTSTIEKLQEYKHKVSTYLDLIPPKHSEIETDNAESTNIAQNTIYFGSPGTGKSKKVSDITVGNNVIQVTFHPEYDYSCFTGGYKPIMNESESIEYKFVPQAFVNAYVRAWDNYVSTKETQHFFLQIEEINRGNCAEIFGDLFQLLDRDSAGNSKYSVDASEELKKYLVKKFGDPAHKGIVNGKLCLPPNLSLIATMNTSDQSLFPMDSAFKRRWNWEYVPIDYNCSESNFKIKLNSGLEYSWLEFIKSVNQNIYEVTQSQDKQVGNWFVCPEDKIISEKELLNKVFFYLWNDVFKDEDDSIFNVDGRVVSYEEFFHNNQANNLLTSILENNLKLSTISSDEVDLSDENSN